MNPAPLAAPEGPVYTLHAGHSPLLISMPHVGTELPAWLQPRLTESAQACPDTDWFLDRLYEFARGLGASLIVPRYSRYVVDLNRPSENTPMYAGQNNTGLCPVHQFTGEPLYRPGREPAGDEVAIRVQHYWQPYHQALAGELQRLRRAHGHAVIFDAHSIKSELPWLFASVLPHLNLGTVDGASCAPALRLQLAELLGAQQRFSYVVDGRFKGGHITRQHGQPQDGIHAVQLEMAWRAYMVEVPPRWDGQRAAAALPLLRLLVQAMIDWRPA